MNSWKDALTDALEHPIPEEKIGGKYRTQRAMMTQRSQREQSERSLWLMLGSASALLVVALFRVCRRSRA